MAAPRPEAAPVSRAHFPLSEARSKSVLKSTGGVVYGTNEEEVMVSLEYRKNERGKLAKT